VFAPENRKETLSVIIGIALLLAGIGLLLTGFVIAHGIVSNPSGYIESQIPPSVQENATQGPRASFTFTVTNLTVTFTDGSRQGDAGIVSWDWDFGDGSRSNQQSPEHTYSGNFNGFVRLTVRDGNNKENSAMGNIQAAPGMSQQGNSTADPGDIAGSIDFSSVFQPILGVLIALAAVVATFFMLMVMCLVGGSIMKAGVNLIRPKPETIRIRVKPKHLEADPVMAAQSGGSGYPAPPPPTS
jgi:hypothetical protein